MVIEMVEVITIEALKPLVFYGICQYVERAYLDAIQFIISERIYPEKAYKPLVENQFIPECV
jgi:hypothetical protein